MMEVLSNWQNIKWNKIEEIIVNWLLIDYYHIFETAALELEIAKLENRNCLENVIFDKRMIQDINQEVAKDILASHEEKDNVDKRFIKRWYVSDPPTPLYDPTDIGDVKYSDLRVFDDYIQDAFSTRPPTPPIRTDSRRKPLLVLDLDETLVHSLRYPKEGNDYIHFTELGYYVHKRPFLDYFLQSVSKYYDIGIWSAGTDEYVEIVIDKIMPEGIEPIFVFGRSMCDRRVIDNYIVYVKPLRILKDFGYRMERMLIVDDTPEKCIDNFCNAIIPMPYCCANQHDSELIDLFYYLEYIKNSADLTTYSHNKWKQFL